METKRTPSATEAASVLRRGGLVAFPTETVYGLGADAFQPEAVAAIFEAKGRPADNPLIVHLATAAQLSTVATKVPESARQLSEHFSPGPITFILPKHPDLPEVVTAGLDTVGVRVPQHETAQEFLRACDTPVAAPSANRSGRPSPTTWEAVAEDLEGRIACILQGGRTDAGVESTVLDCTVDPPVVLRPGAVSVEALRSVLGTVEVADETDESGPKSPGTQHRHYAPAARVHLIQEPEEAVPSSDAGYIGRRRPENGGGFGRSHVVSDVETYAHDLFHFFRECDHAGCAIIYAQTVPDEGLGRALNDRLRRAAAR